MQIGNGTFLLGDCLERMCDIPDASIDMVLCDLPYGIINWTNPYEWDEALDLKCLFIEYLRILKPRSAIVLFGSEPYSTFQRNSHPHLFKYDIIWVKNKVSSFFTAKVKPLRSYEIISVFSEGTTSAGRPNNMPYNPQGLVRKERTVKNTKKDRVALQASRPSLKDEYQQEFTGYPRDVVYFDCESGAHPTQKPVPLFEYLIRTYTDEGMTILDNCAGSGTTAIAAERSGRRWICIEREPEYYYPAVGRVWAELTR